MLRAAGLSLLILLVACPQPEPPTPQRNTAINLELTDTWTTSVTLKISVEDTSTAWGFALSRDDSTVVEGLAYGRDTTIIDSRLEPDREYSYTAYFMDGAALRDSSNTLTVTTLDTTSHDFTWEIDTLGIYGSYLNDVAIVNENDIWVVGEIVLPDPDSSFNGTGRETFNAAHWDGNEWEMIGIYSNTQ